MRHSRVVVVGAGPTGAALSLILASRGVEVVLVERETSFERVFRGEALMPNGVDALRQLGVAGEVEALPHIAVPCMELFVDGTRLLRAALSHEHSRDRQDGDTRRRHAALRRSRCDPPRRRRRRGGRP